MLKSILVITSITIASSVFGQLTDAEKELKKEAKGTQDSTKTWVKGGNLNINATQVALSNWAGGGQNSISLQGILGLYAHYSKGKTAWDNSLDLAYGLIKTGRADWFKNDDRIELNSKFGHRASKNWYYAGLLNFRTQFYEGFAQVGDQNFISNFMAPGYTTIAIGMDYKSTNKKLGVFISPATVKVTAVLNDSLSNAGTFGVPAGQKIRNEFGGYVRINFDEPKLFGNENLGFKSNVSLFSNYAQDPQNIDVTVDAILTAKIAKYFSVSLMLNLIYDHDVQIQRFDEGNPVYYTREDGTFILDGNNDPIIQKGPITQMKEVLAIGFAYKF